MNVTERIAKDISVGKGPRISADQLRAAIRRALVRGAASIVESAPHPRGGQSTIGLLVQSWIDDWGFVNVIIVAGRGKNQASTSSGAMYLPAFAMRDALTGRRRPKVFPLFAEISAKGGGKWKILYDGDEEVI